MKPVPISQYLDHIGRVAQADLPSSRRETSPFTPRAVRVVQNPELRSPLAFSRVLLEAAIAARSRTPGEEQERAASEGRSSSRETGPSRSRETPPAPDIEARVAEAYDRGLREGLATARAENAETLAREQASQQERTLMERLDFQLNEYAGLADVIETGLVEIEQRIAATVARILAPFLTSALSKQVVDELCANIARLRAGGSPGLLGALRDRVSFLSVDVEFVVEDRVEATIEAQHTMIGSELQPWADLIASLVV
jgi:flagellar biosynthesis/type III secretory pathway protein FliH